MRTTLQQTVRPSRPWTPEPAGWRIFLAAVAVAFVTVAGAVALRAQSDDFSSGTDSGWTRYDPLAALGQPAATFSFPSGGYEIANSTSTNTPPAFGPARAGSLRLDTSYSDFSVTYDLVNWNNSYNQAIGALVRGVQPGPGTTDGYAFTYSTSGSIDISRILNESATGLAATTITLSPANDYRFVFTGVGSSLSGVVYDLANLTTPLATVNATDATYASGFSGLLIFARSSPGAADATFDNFVAIVPEPSALALLALAGVVVGWKARQAHRRNTRS